MNYDQVITFEISNMLKVPGAISIGLNNYKYNDFTYHPTTLSEPYIFSINPRISPTSDIMYFYESNDSVNPYGYVDTFETKKDGNGYYSPTYFIGEFKVYNGDITKYNHIYINIDTSALVGYTSTVTISVDNKSHDFDVSSSLQSYTFSVSNSSCSLEVSCVDLDTTMYTVRDENNSLIFLDGGTKYGVSLSNLTTSQSYTLIFKPE